MIRNFLIRSFAGALFIMVSFAGMVHSQTGASGDTGRAQISGTVFGLGANFSATSGIGVSLRLHLPDRISGMVTGYGFKTSDEVMYNFGFELQYDVVVKERLRFYALGGVSHFYDEFRNGPPPTTNTYSDPDRFGGGFGVEVYLTGLDICVAAEIALTSFQPSGDLIPYPSANVHYYFR
ncbi:MAG: outer membrane beta-barrel protein [Bacteroidota bacterium]|nr:outer membrane beta-barrel protein [Bacteroidota bacterium]MDP4233783.1 outer membrane beta-barrel protein [Bacteroidota bacterium]MDP4242422.1 outer membrane beta-barrel protein [Bacteroidota bacterium]MDP4287544.1 outer membrane beta-barrel protein [Bacteroidota bacterium]